MQANKFVKNNPWLLKHGAKGLKDIIADAKEYKYFCLSNLGHSYANHSAGVSVAISDLKRLVESLELIKSFKTKKNANAEFMKACMRGQTERANMIKKAIADVESCQPDLPESVVKSLGEVS